jgi:hypothetical protein
MSMMPAPQHASVRTAMVAQQQQQRKGERSPAQRRAGGPGAIEAIIRASLLRHLRPSRGKLRHSGGASRRHRGYRGECLVSSGVRRDASDQCERGKWGRVPPQFTSSRDRSMNLAGCIFAPAICGAARAPSGRCDRGKSVGCALSRNCFREPRPGCRVPPSVNVKLEVAGKRGIEPA